MEINLFIMKDLVYFSTCHTFVLCIRDTVKVRGEVEGLNGTVNYWRDAGRTGFDDFGSTRGERW